MLFRSKDAHVRLRQVQPVGHDFRVAQQHMRVRLCLEVDDDLVALGNRHVTVQHTNTVHLAYFFFKQKTAYEMRISDWSSDVCSSDLTVHVRRGD